MRYCDKCGNPFESNLTVCSKCGNSLVENNNINNTNFNKTPIVHKRISQEQQNIIIGLLVGIGILCSVFMCTLAYRSLNNSVFISDNSRENSNISDMIDEKKNYISKRGKYQTIIISDNIYEGLTISGEEEGYKLISKDSVEQKKNCPKEIVALENEFIKNYGITAVNLCEINTDFSKKVYSVFGKVYTEFPNLKNYLTNLTIMNDSSDSDFITAFQPYFEFAYNDGGYPVIVKTQMFLNAKYFLNENAFNETINANVKIGHFPSNAVMSSIVAHELGHYISFLTMMYSHSLDSMFYVDNEEKQYKLVEVLRDFNDEKYSLELLETAYNNYINDTNDNIEFDLWRSTISGYAISRDNSGEYIYDETIAESFHDVYLNGNNAKEASKYVYNELKSRFERLVK